MNQKDSEFNGYKIYAGIIYRIEMSEANTTILQSSIFNLQFQHGGLK